MNPYKDLKYHGKYHAVSAHAAMESLSSSEKGLTEQEAQRRLAHYGHNEIKKEKRVSKLKLFLAEFANFLVLILVAAALVSLFIGNLVDATAIFAIVVLNTSFGFIQNYKAEKAIEALRKLSTPKAVAVRNGAEKEILAKMLVPGDVIIVNSGEKVPADARVIKSYDFAVDESILTGESVPVAKDSATLHDSMPVVDQKNMLFMNSVSTRGRAMALVVATGMNTEIGRIATELEEIKEPPTPLQTRIEGLGKFLGAASLAICFVIFAMEMLKGGELLKMFIFSVSLAVAAIPEGLPAVVTLSLALGVKRMAKKNALVRRLPSVETLGCVDVICTDKTGTLTENKMVVEKIFCNEKLTEMKKLSSSGFNPKGVDLLFIAGALCNNAKVEMDFELGDPTEIALLRAAEGAGINLEKLETDYPRIDEIPFDSSKKYMVTIHKKNEKKIEFIKGSPIVVLGMCGYVYNYGVTEKLTETKKENILKTNDEMAANALRVLGFAYKENDKTVFLGLQGMYDPPRKEVKGAIAECRRAGIRVMMVTGDQKLTAVAIAREINLDSEKVMTGDELGSVSGKDLKKIVEEINIFARVSPEHKIMILNALKENGHVVAMTGDGVNDAPALKSAQVGVSMGIRGTDITKEASDMILTDDNFLTIVSAVKEGRAIYDNIQKFVNYLLSTNFAEILVIFIASLMFLPLPIIAVQILWINLLSDGLPALALGVDPADRDIMKRKPRNPKERIITKDLGINMLFASMLMVIGVLSIFMRELDTGASIARAQTMVFTSFIVFEIIRLQTLRSQYKIGAFSNKWLIGAVLLSLALQLIVIYTPLSVFFGTLPLTKRDWVVIGAVGVATFFINTLFLFVRKRI